MINKLIVCLIVSSLSLTFSVNGQTKFNDKPFIIDIKENIQNIKSIKLSTIGKELSYIPLETTPECMLQEVRKVEFSDSYIFVSEINNLFQFDKSGKFIRQIGSQGRGPQEYLYVSEFCINNKTNEIYIFSMGQMLVFGFDGVYKRSIKLSFRVSQVVLLDNETFMHHLPNASGDYFNKYSWIITDLQGSEKQKFINHLIRVSQPGLAVSTTPLYMYNNTVHFMEFGIDTLYYLNKSQKVPYTIFNFGDLKMDPDPLISKSIIKENKFADKLWISSISENQNFLFIEFYRGISSGKMNAAFDKKSGSLTFLEDNSFSNDLGGGARFWPKQVINDNILIDYIDAFDLLKMIIPSDLRRKLTPTSNPILMILK